jgi:hypothetical protein
MMHFNGPAYEPTRDSARLTTQHVKIRELMLDGQWRTLRQIAELTGEPESSISAQLRHLRKPRFGGYTVERSHIQNGLYEYRVLK